MDEQKELELEEILKEFGHASEAGAEENLEDIVLEFRDEPAAEEDVEEILKEFGHGPQEDAEEANVLNGAMSGDTIAAPQVSAEILKQVAEKIKAEPVEEETPVQGEPALTGDTIRMGAITESAASAVGGDTIRMKPINSDTMRLDTKDLPKGKVHIAQPISDEEEKEAFAEGWEPEYEQPMGSYNPPPPIIVHPKSRLRELKRKLVAGPEKRYYELAGQGLGKLQAAIFFSLLVLLLSAAAMVLFALDMIPQERLRLMVFSQFFGLLLSALLGSFQIIDGVADIFKGSFSMNSLLFFSFLFCCVDGVLCLQQQRIPCCAAFSLQVVMSLWSAYHKRYTEMGQMDTLRKATYLDGLAACPDYLDGKKGFLRQEGQVEHFMDNYGKVSAPEKIMGWYALGVLAASIVIGVAAYLLSGISAAVQAAAVSCLAGAPAVIFISLSRPMALLERRLHKLGTVLCGWQGVKGLTGKAVVPVEHFDLFPAGTVKLNGVKFYGPRRPDDIVAYCTALITADGGGLVGLFQQVSDSRNAPRYDAKNVEAVDGGGIRGTVHAEPVLVGSLEFMEQMGVELPEGLRVSNAVCVAIENELCGLFALTYEKAKAPAAGLATVCASRKLQPVVAVSDFAMTDGLLRRCFGSHTKKVIYPEQEVRAQLRQAELPEEATSLLMTTKEGFAPVAYGISGARSLKTASFAGLIVSMAGGVLGLAMMVMLVLLGAMQMLTPINMLAYQLVWLIPGWIITSWTRIL